MKRSQLFRTIALGGYFGLLLLILNWYTWLSPPQAAPVALVLIVLLGPLLFPLRGLLHGKPYTYAWSSLLSLFYFGLGVDVAFNSEPDRLYGLLEILFSVMLFNGSIYYVRYQKREAATERP